ncbi:hypothetical protein CDD80_2937 [Ophiocordyceps camponoti-rufipedis]|uniref:Swiss Army Knife protein DSP-PTPase phosphatase domain-containing protein n=1 Tax=Ophiocordyceps camponoti-rufipedis TaxID=2004952 RepID=A0A2C5Z3T9_9HYPO|nr:hypothetical protein CDD80_2937 [Ophiocordyceps camponoti-rufipedis]
MHLRYLTVLLNVAAASAWSLRTKTDQRALHDSLARRSPYEQVKGPSNPQEVTGNYESEGPGFWRFEWVNDFLQPGDRLARSSAPHYNCQDCDQKLTPASIKFLKDRKISHVISLNNEATSQSIKRELINNGIAYTALPTRDFEAPTQKDLRDGYEAFKKNRHGTLVWCGYGHGRTGTMISALQILSNHDNASGKKISHWEYKSNHVETDDQIHLLDTLQKTLHAADAHKHSQGTAADKSSESKSRPHGKENGQDQASNGKSGQASSKTKQGQESSQQKPGQKASGSRAGQESSSKAGAERKPSRDSPKTFSSGQDSSRVNSAAQDSASWESVPESDQEQSNPRPESQQQQPNPDIDRPKRFGEEGSKPNVNNPKKLVDPSSRSSAASPPNRNNKKFGTVSSAASKAPSTGGPKVMAGSGRAPAQRFGSGTMTGGSGPRRMSQPARTWSARRPGGGGRRRTSRGP